MSTVIEVRTLMCTKADGTLSSSVVACMCGDVTRSIGLMGDRLSVRFAADLLPEDWDLARGTLTLDYGFDTESVLLGGYKVENVMPHTLAKLTDAGAFAPREITLAMVTEPGRWNQGRGPMIMADIDPPCIINPVKPNGRVDPAHANFRTAQEMATIALDSICAGAGWGGVGVITHAAVPASIDTAIDGTTVLDPPAGKDWGNADAVYELEGLLRRYGWSVALNLDGNMLTPFRLTRGGEAVVVPGALDSVVQPYRLDPMKSVRPGTIAVTSGATRSIIVDQLTLFDLEWVRLDGRTGTWMNGAEWEAAYPTEIAPGDIDAYNEGPPAAEDGELARKQWQTIFRALRIADPELRAKCSAFVAVPESIEIPDGPGPLAGTIGFIAARAAIVRDNQLENVPAVAADDMVRMDGCTFVRHEGVVQLPTEFEFVRLADSPGVGGFADAVPLALGGGTAEDLGDLTLVFARESREGQHAVDFYRSVWRVINTAGVLSVERITVEGDIEAAFKGREAFKVHVPSLRRYLTWAYGDTDPTPLDDDAVHEIAEQVALQRASDDLVIAGVVELRGFHEIAPGDWGGAVSAVTWSIDRGMTIVQVNTHEAMNGVLELAAQRAGQSVAAGLGRLCLSGSWMGLDEIRSSPDPASASGAIGAGGLGGFFPSAGEHATSRGRERTMPATHQNAPGASPAKDQVEHIWVVLTAATSVTTNVWDYDWAEVRLLGTSHELITGGRTSDTHGKARNTLESGNAATGYLGNDVEIANIADGWSVKPIGLNGEVERPILIRGPYGAGEDRRWVFTLANAIDGECAA